MGACDSEIVAKPVRKPRKGKKKSSKKITSVEDLLGFDDIAASRVSNKVPVFTN